MPTKSQWWLNCYWVSITDREFDNDTNIDKGASSSCSQSSSSTASAVCAMDRTPPTSSSGDDMGSNRSFRGEVMSETLFDLSRYNSASAKSYQSDYIDATRTEPAWDETESIPTGRTARLSHLVMLSMIPRKYPLWKKKPLNPVTPQSR